MRKPAILMASILLVLSGCAAQKSISTEPQTTSSQTESVIPVEPSDEEKQKAEDTMRLLIGEIEVPVTWENNASVEELKELSPVTIQMSMYGGFEQVGSIG